MARSIPDWQRPIVAEWLRTTRMRQRREDGEPWSQEDFLHALEADTGRFVHRPNYSNYEQRGGMEPSTLRAFVDFWAKRGEAGPDLREPSEPPAVADPVAAAIREQTKVLQDLVSELKAMRETVDATRSAVDANGEGVVSVLGDLARVVAALPYARGTGTEAAGR